MSYDPTVIDDRSQRFTEAVAAVAEARQQHWPLIQAFSAAWYKAPQTYGSVTVFGTPALKCPLDLWAYQELIGRLMPRTILETGTAYGGSALWYALCLDAWGADPDAQVITIDVTARPNRPEHPRLRYVTGDSSDADLLTPVLETSPAPWLISLDSDHRAAHVSRELDLFAPYTLPGDYLIVEDTCVDRLPPDEPGPYAAVAPFLAAHPEWRQDIWFERYWLTFNPGGWLVRT